MGRFITKARIGREVDEISRIHELLVPRMPDDVQPLAGRDVKNSIAIIPFISGASGASAASELISPPAPEAPFSALDLSEEVDYSMPIIPAIQSTLPEVEDRRMFHPEAIRDVQALRTVRGNAVRYKVPIQGRVALPSPHVAVKAEASVIFCIRRKNRRGVLLALGQGGGYHRPPRRSPTSDLWCE